MRRQSDAVLLSDRKPSGLYCSLPGCGLQWPGKLPEVQVTRGEYHI